MPRKIIMLVCTGGMSSSLLVGDMQQVAKEKQSDAYIFAVSELEVEKKLQDKAVDIVLLSPQARHLKNKVEAWPKKTDGCLVETITKEDFSTINGERILDKALDLLSRK
ncbi:MAG: PTS sugar transporter subunit IIB [Alkalibacterium sp.]|uniref:PTS system, cellobiose-specific IIB component n=1 Tax=Alkalibacterium gilvum TaxID=1130080 RepID=A0A1H6RLP2_9LACT|nr:hypothetical protein [Alkalibacterium gilvum]MDN6294412.1 PTS sugar transporter subunit IIB [Alkalibacterium sp.]SEI53467.1 PTS system, cellobiose-specific IIB component [Alkalibacterium gilvum]